MLFAELEARIARLEEAAKPFGSPQEWIGLYESEPAERTDEGQVLFRLPNGGMGLGHTERGKFHIYEQFSSESEACVHVWNGRVEDFLRGGGTPAYMMRVLFAPRVTDEALGREVAASTDLVRLSELAHHADPGIRARVARREDLPPEVLTLLAEDAAAQEDVAANTSTPAKVLLRLAASSNARVRFQVATNRSTPAAAFSLLAADSDIGVNWRVAGSALTAPELLAELAASPRQYTHRFLAANPATPPEVLEGFESSDDFAVRWALAANPSTPLEVLGRLVHDADYGVRWGIASNPSATDVLDLVDDAEQGVRVTLAHRNEGELLSQLARDPDGAVRRAVASNVATPPESLATLELGPDDDFVAVWLIGNPSTPRARVAELARDK